MRAITGVGAALIFPATLSIITNVFSEPVERQKAIAIWASTAGNGHLAVTVNLAPEDPRFLDLRRNVLSKIERAMPNVTINVAGRTNNADADRYGEVDYSYAGRTDMSRSTSPREILPLIYGLAGITATIRFGGTGLPRISIGHGRPLGDAVVLRPAAFGHRHFLVGQPPSSEDH